MDVRVRSRNESPEPGITHSKLTQGNKSKESKSRNKGMLISFFDNQGIAHKEFVAQGHEKKNPVSPQHPHSPDLSPCDFFLSPRVKMHLKELHFATLSNIGKAVTDQLKAILVSALQHCYDEWKNRL
ncbi:hypothetical protein AVEN_52353-1 [Araneus ventricosus]|uniref:Uncharacterized protein n=1 Tax=Araneus ventricosus TaxID=182803 RepID=A0A4Y2IUF4_ARAVE|nr:hypothetical protein AVEN_52353-1 [Araneus ventricosus]